VLSRNELLVIWQNSPPRSQIPGSKYFLLAYKHAKPRVADTLAMMYLAQGIFLSLRLGVKINSLTQLGRGGVRFGDARALSSRPNTGNPAPVFLKVLELFFLQVVFLLGERVAAASRARGRLDQRKSAPRLGRGIRQIL